MEVEMDATSDDLQDEPVSPTSRTGRHSSSAKKRSTRACDQCRKTKSRCDLSSAGGKCTSCDATNVECTTSGPARKRGPAKGYLHALETRLQEVEAFLGVMLSVEDPRLQSFVQDISKDPIAKGILQKVNDSPFGPKSSEQSADSQYGSTSRSKDPFSKGHSNEWQKRVINLLTPRAPLASAGSSETLLDTPSMSVATAPATGATRSTTEDKVHHNLKPHHSLPSEREVSGSLTGQLAMDNRKQLHYYGRASGLDLLNQSPRSDAANVGGVWKIPQTEHYQQRAMPVKLDMPSPGLQLHLVEIYFTYVYPCFPIIAKEQFWKQFHERKNLLIRDGQSMQPDPFDLLLLTIFSIAARRSPHGRGDVWNEDGVSVWEAGDDYFAQAKALIDRTYHLSHPTICQALLMLGVREFGMGAAAQAWLFTGMAIRMAQDLGMHRSPESWYHSGRSLFTEDQITARKRIWYGCVRVDKYISMFMGRPVAIRTCDFDTILPDAINSEETEEWTHHPSQVHTGYFTAVSGRFISCFNVNISLSTLVGRILEALYGVRKDGLSSQDLSSADDLRSQLIGWRHNLPHHLQLNSTEEKMKSPPHVLALHTGYWCAVILLHRPFIRTQKPDEPAEVNSMSASAWEQSLIASNEINELILVWRANFFLENAFPFFAFDVWHAGIIWLAALTLRKFDAAYLPKLDLCLDALKEMETTFPAAGRCRRLLLGAKVQRPDSTLQSREGGVISLSPTTGQESFLRTDRSLPPDLSHQTYGSRGSQYVHQLLNSGVPGVESADPRFLNGYHWTDSPAFSILGMSSPHHLGLPPSFESASLPHIIPQFDSDQISRVASFVHQ